MPAKYRVKLYVQDGYYYIYNTGVDDRELFLDDRDYQFFLELLRSYLSPPSQLAEDARKSPYKQKKREDMNLNKDVSLLAYCMTPSKIQLLVKQSSVDGITKFMRRICTSYVSYFNRRHHRVGHLFQGVYKGELISDQEKFTTTISLIHQAPITVRKLGLIATTSGSGANYPYSSYHYYLSDTAPSWIKVGLTLNT